MHPSQPGILAAPIPAQARHLFFALESAEALPQALASLARLVDGETLVAGLGAVLLQALDRHVAGLRVFPALEAAVEIPSTQHALWCWLRGDDRGELLLRSRELAAALAPALRLVQASDAFRYRDGRDLTGYEDGTENPEGDEAVAAAIVADGGAGLRGGSFAAVQHWVHDLEHFEAMQPEECDDCIGRRRSDNEELDDAPESAHVKRTAQESFSPEAFVVRRSMPWADGMAGGLMFVAFGHSLDAFQAQLRRMVGLEDGIVDALFRFTRPVSGAYFWCPGMKNGRLKLPS